jgi:hypothetical protein
VPVSIYKAYQILNIYDLLRGSKDIFGEGVKTKEKRNIAPKTYV